VIVQLGARNWIVGDIDWSRRIAYVEPVEVVGRSRWRGRGLALSYELCQSMRKILAGADPAVEMTERTTNALRNVRDDFPAADGDALVLAPAGDRTTLWTFAGLRANATLAIILEPLQAERSGLENLTITLDAGADPVRVRELLNAADVADACARTPVDARALDALKFSECLPEELAFDLLRERLVDAPSVVATANRSIRVLEDVRPADL
jgi:ATP-dependent Lhr-like helicase